VPERPSQPEIDAIVEQRVQERLAEEAERRERAELVGRLATLEERLAEMEPKLHALAAGFKEMADAVGMVEQGQLSKQARTKVLGYSAGGGVMITAIIEGIARLLS
jgi:hypothetical protein